MATNQYFRSNYNASLADQKLTEDLIVESIQAYGVDVYYLPRSFVNRDELFGEDQSSAFSEAMTIEMYITSIDGFGGDGHFLSKFGLEIRDEIQLSVARRRFAEQSTNDGLSIPRPREGDLIKMPSSVDKRERIFEIAFVDDDQIFYQLGDLYTYGLRCNVFEYGGESFDTGVDDIDDFETDYSIDLSIDLTNVNGTFTEGETVEQANSTGQVASWDGSTIVLTKVSGFDQVTTDPIVGQTSGATGEPVEDSEQYTNEAQSSDNEYFNNQATATFDPKNPFGE